MEKDDEISGTANSFTAAYWQYDPRLGRRWNLDPIFKDYESPFSSFSNNPIWFIDPDGRDTLKVNNGLPSVDLPSIEVSANRPLASANQKPSVNIYNKIVNFFLQFLPNVNGNNSASASGDEISQKKRHKSLWKDWNINTKVFMDYLGALTSTSNSRDRVWTKDNQNRNNSNKELKRTTSANESRNAEINEPNIVDFPAPSPVISNPNIDTIYERVNEIDHSFNIMIIRDNKVPIDTFYYAPTPEK